MKKLTCLLLSLLAVLTVLVGCSSPSTSDPGNNTYPTGDPNVKGVHYDEDGNLVVPRYDGVTLTIGIPESAHVLDYDDNYYTQWLEEMTGIDLVFEKFASDTAGYKQQLATTTAAGTIKLPDILFNFVLGEDLIRQYGEDEYLMDLTEFMEDEEKSWVFWNRLNTIRNDPNGDWEAFADRVELLMHEDSRGTVGEGPIYVLPTVSTSLVDTIDFIPYINTKWLDIVKKDMPTNLTELVDVLRAFDTIDCNGDGMVEDQIPMIGSKSGTLSGDIVAWLLNFYVYFQDQIYFNIDANGQLYLPQTTDAYREGLKFIRGLIEEGLLHPSSLAYTYTNVRTLLNAGDTVGVVVGQPSLIFQGGDASYRFEPMNLFGNVYYNEDTVSLDNFITTDCANPSAAFDLLMLMYTYESAVIQRFGEEGVNWEKPAEGVMTAMGLPATVKVIEEVWSKPQNLHWATCNSITTYDVFDLIDASDADAFTQRKWELFGKVTGYYGDAYDRTLATVGEAKICPWLRFSEEEDEMAPNRNGLKTDMSSWRSYFLTGTEDINDPAAWDKYMQALEKAGLQAYLAAGQKCYERMYKSNS